MKVRLLLRWQEHMVEIDDPLMSAEFIEKFKKEVKYIVLNNHPTEQLVILKEDIQTVQISREANEEGVNDIDN